MKDSEFLNWIADRLINVYGETENVDFVIKLRTVAANINVSEETLKTLKAYKDFVDKFIDIE